MDIRYCSKCGAEYDALKGPHNCDPHDLEILDTEAENEPAN